MNKITLLFMAMLLVGCGNPNDSPPGTPAHCSVNFAHVTVHDDGSHTTTGCISACPGVICWEVCEAIARTRRDNHVICPCDGIPCEDQL